jgi:hypothetical protein
VAIPALHSLAARYKATETAGAEDLAPAEADSVCPVELQGDVGAVFRAFPAELQAESGRDLPASPVEFQAELEQDFRAFPVGAPVAPLGRRAALPRGRRVVARLRYPTEQRQLPEQSQ